MERTLALAKEISVPERDKPFILLIIGLVSLIGLGAAAIFSGHWNDAKDFILFLGGMVMSGWGYYFGNQRDKI